MRVWSILAVFGALEVIIGERGGGGGGGGEARVFGVGRKVNGNFNSSTEISKVLEKAGPNIEKEEEKGNLRMG